MRWEDCIEFFGNVVEVSLFPCRKLRLSCQLFVARPQAIYLSFMFRGSLPLPDDKCREPRDGGCNKSYGPP